MKTRKDSQKGQHNNTNPVLDSRIDIKQRAHQIKLIESIEQRIFNQTNNSKNYEKHDIKISEQQVISTYYIKPHQSKQTNFYISHGFGGSSLMFFPIMNEFLKKGNVVLWEVRGMGVGIKCQYKEIQTSKINDFYVEGLARVIEYYNHQKIIFACHSLSAHIALRYMMKYPNHDRIQRAILFSPVGLTSKQRDQKNTIRSCSGLLNSLINSFGWKFRLTFKSPMRTVLKCLKRKILSSAFAQFSFPKQDHDLMVDLFLTLVELSDGSQNIFFRYFLPKVLPRNGSSIQQLFRPGQITQKVSIYYGGDSDWVDKKGAQYLSQKYSNFSVNIIRQCGHMLCLNIPQMKFILSNEIK